MRHWFHPQSDRTPGNFHDGNHALLALFGDPDARGGRSWRQTFGYESTKPSRSRSQAAID